MYFSTPKHSGRLKCIVFNQLGWSCEHMRLMPYYALIGLSTSHLIQKSISYIKRGYKNFLFLNKINEFHQEMQSTNPEGK